ncbi:hypothetical protein FGO68_gene17449 [Halteria grandinella]|uniref:Diphosphomevalonate decarboxylase n=1 Tax=Halteria grandinella TaxID=5974 RepID=A0A8J8T181_HALGN|nr:hypothetical protein FGO68_gene17449 [Halteria grandinella]
MSAIPKYDRATKSLSLTATSPINIALVKYWGKVHESLIIPANSSLSITIDQADLCSKTKVELIPTAEGTEPQVRLVLNGKEDKITSRIRSIIDLMRERTEGVRAHDDSGYTLTLDASELRTHSLLITSENNFATASGLASSSSGLSCLAFVLSQLYGVPESFPGEYTKFARLGSGSACRSLYGGFVQWHRGFQAIQELTEDAAKVSDQSLARAVELSQESMEWWYNNLSILICVVNPGDAQTYQKDVPSTDGMKITLETSELMKLRLEADLAQKHIDQLTGYLEARDFPKFAELTMKESNQLHAVCLDTYPPIFYMNETSRQIIKTATKLNGQGNIVAYSIDAGFHVFLFTLKEDYVKVHEAMSVLPGIDQIIITRIGREGVKLI